MWRDLDNAHRRRKASFQFFSDNFRLTHFAAAHRRLSADFKHNLTTLKSDYATTKNRIIQNIIHRKLTTALLPQS